MKNSKSALKGSQIPQSTASLANSNGNAQTNSNANAQVNTNTIATNHKLPSKS